MARKTIKVDYLARVEGEGALTVVIRNGAVADAQLRIFEPPRFFEAFLRGRAYGEAPDITARICGICPVAYQMSAVHAMEDVLGIKVGGQLRALRRLLYCGEWIESHTLHVYMLHAPDFLGYHGAVEMARDHADIVKRGLELKKIGNALMTIVGGREVHPVNVRVGGFYKAPRKRDLLAFAGELRRARDLALETVRWTAGLDFPDRTREYELVSLSHPDEYPMNEGRIVSNRGLDIDAREYDAHFEEIHVAHSNALQARIRERGHYLVGPLARFALNFDKLSPLCREAAHEAGIAPICTNPYQSIVVRAVEVLYACDEALRIVEDYEEPDQPFIAAEPRAGVGQAATEAPRGMIYHRYRLAEDGKIEDAVIIPPTSQNQASVEDDLKVLINGWIDLPEDELRHRCEQTVRNYDPCISCATHFLDLRVDRE
ncbi:MAG: Ni/Fe hydrogenase subunit alpha [Bauldia sp.]|nr:Ni/Fe hydrogenase subunit alpha [Bauldia sp.]